MTASSEVRSNCQIASGFLGLLGSFEHISLIPVPLGNWKMLGRLIFCPCWKTWFGWWWLSFDLKSCVKNRKFFPAAAVGELRFLRRGLLGKDLFSERKRASRFHSLWHHHLEAWALRLVFVLAGCHEESSRTFGGDASLILPSFALDGAAWQQLCTCFAALHPPSQVEPWRNSGHWIILYEIKWCCRMNMKIQRLFHSMLQSSWLTQFHCMAARGRRVTGTWRMDKYESI